MHRTSLYWTSVFFLIGFWWADIAVAVTPVTPDPSPEARGLLNYIHVMYGKKTLSGQMCGHWGVDELEVVRRVTGKVRQFEDRITFWKSTTPRKTSWRFAGGKREAFPRRCGIGGRRPKARATTKA